MRIAGFIRYLSDRDRGWILGLIAAVCLVYLPFLDNPFIFDDVKFFSVGVKGGYVDSWPALEPRWLPYLTLGRTYAQFFDVYPHLYHLGNALLHAANVLLLFYLVRRLLAAVMPDVSLERARNAALLAALVFAVHPVAVYAVGYIVQRSILMATLFSLLMQLFFLRALMSGRRRWLVLTVLTYLLACFSKEHSVLAPALLVAMVLLLRAGSRFHWRVWLAGGAACLGVALWITMLSHAALGAPYEVMADRMFLQQGVAVGGTMLHVLSAMNQAGLFFKYLGLWLFPNVGWMSIDIREPFIGSLSDWRVWLGSIAFVIYGMLALRNLLQGGARGLVGFALLYPWLLYGVEMAGVRVQEPFVLYRSYLWVPGLMVLLALVVVSVRLRHLRWVASGVLVVVLALSWNRLWVMADNYRLWDDAAQKLPHEDVAGADRIYYNRGHYAAEAQLWDKAVPDFEKAAQLAPSLAPVQHALGVAYFNTGRSADALARYDAAVGLDPEYAEAWFNRGWALKRMHQDGLALASMRQSCKLNYWMACFIAAGAKQKTSGK